MIEKFNLTWHEFESHGKNLLRNLMETEEFSDVTLVFDDQHHYKAHRFVLNSCSSVFRNILTNNQVNTLIYLRGINHEELESILRFIYLGEATFYQERMNEFLNFAKNFDIKEIGKNTIHKESVELKSNENDHEEPLKFEFSNQIKNESTIVSSVNTSLVNHSKFFNTLVPGEKLQRSYKQTC